MSALTERVRRPEYVGENRCTPCTVVNLVIAFGLGVALFEVLAVLSNRSVAVVAAAILLVVSVASIYFRGYLVPGTPALTKRYLPDPVLRWFGKSPEPVAVELDGSDSTAVLERLGALTADGDGHRLRDGLHADLFADLEPRDDAEETVVALRDEVGLSAETATVEPRAGGDGYSLRVDGDVVTAWPSGTAATADLAAAEHFDAGHPAVWTALDPTARLAALRELRTSLDDCPVCGAALELRQHELDFCCIDDFLPVLACTDCGADVTDLSASLEDE